MLYSPYVQTRLVKYFTTKIEKSTGIKLQIGGVSFFPVQSLVLEDVLLNDYRNDTLLYSKQIKMKIDTLNLISRKLTIDELTFDRAYFNIYVERKKDDSDINISMLLDSLSGGDDAESSWDIGLQKISVKNSRFRYRENEYEELSYGINWTDVECTGLSLEIPQPDFSGEQTYLEVRNLSFKEKSGFVLERMDGKAIIGGNRLIVNDLSIITPFSDLNLEKLQYDWIPGNRDWRYFTSRMQQYYKVTDSRVDFRDLAYFNAKLRGMENPVSCRGVVSNTVNRLEGKDIAISFGSGSSLNADFKSYGLPHIEGTVFDINFREAFLSPADLETIYLPWMDYRVSFPLVLHQIPEYNVDGNFKGTIDDFVLTLTSRTPGVEGGGHLNYKTDKENTERVLLSGRVTLPKVDLGIFVREPLLGEANILLAYRGELKEGLISTNISARAHTFRFNQQTVRNTFINFTWTNDLINMISSVRDRNVRLDLQLSGNTNDSLPRLVSTGSLEIADLSLLGLSFTGENEHFATDFDISYAGETTEKTGTVKLSDLSYKNPIDSLFIKDILAEQKTRGDESKLSIFSDILDLEMEGEGISLGVFKYIGHQLSAFLPVYRVNLQQTDTIGKTFENADFAYSIKNKDVNRVMKVFYPDIRISQKAYVESKVDAGGYHFDLRMVADTIFYGRTRIIDPKLHADGTRHLLEMVSSAGTIKFGNIFNAYNVRNELTLKKDEIDGKVSWANWGEKTYSGDLSANIRFVPLPDEKYKTEVHINPGLIVMGDSVWKLKQSRMIIEDGNIDIQHFSVNNEEQFMALSGKITENPEDLFSVKLNHLDIEKLNNMLAFTELKVFGIIDGEIQFKNNLLHSDLYIENWGVGADTLGTLKVNSFWDTERNNLIIEAENRLGQVTPFLVSGFYNPSTGHLDLDVKLEDLDISYLNGYTSGLYQDGAGKISGDVRISGPFSRLSYDGYINLDQVGIKIPALNTNFFINDTIFLKENKVQFKDFRIRDIHENLSKVNGFYHLQNNRYELDIASNNFMIMNTRLEHNDAFYGRVFLSSLIQLRGSEKTNEININARTENQSELFIPLSSYSSGNKSSILHFVNVGHQETEKEIKETYKKHNIILNANLELNDNLKVQLVFDPSVGDILKASGNGDIRIEVDQDGMLNLFGEYTLSKGNYIFTLGGLVDKTFNLQPGGTISFNGSPYEAAVDIDAVYSLKTSINELLTVSDSEESLHDRSTKVPVECVLSLSDNITSPLVSFDINFPSLDMQTKSAAESLFSSDDEKNHQVFSLLVFNRFYKPDYMGEMESEERNFGYQAGITTVSEFFSNQLSRWLSGINNNFDIGVQYRMGGEITADELELALSTQLLNDRLTVSINGNVDVGNKNLSNNPNNSNNIVGDFDVEFRLNEEGTLKLKAYSHTDEKIITKNSNETTQGIGVSYQETFDTFRELLNRYLGFFKKKKKN